MATMSTFTSDTEWIRLHMSTGGGGAIGGGVPCIMSNAGGWCGGDIGGDGYGQ